MAGAFRAVMLLVKGNAVLTYITQHYAPPEFADD